MNFWPKSKLTNRSIRSVQGSALVVLLMGSSSGFAAQQTNNSFVRPDYSAFRIVVDRNIFNSKRSRDYVAPDRIDRPRATPKSESLALVGTMNQGAGPMAFFEGSKSDYRKVLKHQENIAGFKIAEIQPSFVKLASSTNEIELRLGMQLVREEEGPWHVTARPESLEAPAVSTTSSRSYSRSSSNNRSSDTSSGRSSDNQPSFPDFGNLPFNPNAFFPGGPQPGDQQSPPAVNTAPAANGSAGSSEDVLTILRRRREQENNP